MKIKRQGVVRICTEKDYKLKYKKQGYKIVEEDKEEAKKDLQDMTKKEIKKILKENDLPIYGTKAELIERLEEGD